MWSRSWPLHYQSLVATAIASKNIVHTVSYKGCIMCLLHHNKSYWPVSYDPLILLLDSIVGLLLHVDDLFISYIYYIIKGKKWLRVPNFYFLKKILNLFFHAKKFIDSANSHWDLKKGLRIFFIEMGIFSKNTLIFSLFFPMHCY